jgi:NAD(P)-dependent dehydrogenase (short-subunit alcohol dehydrogenase family)
MLLNRGRDPKSLEEDLLDTYKINVIGNIHLLNLYMPLILKGTVKKVIVISSGYADFALNNDFDCEEAGPYCLSKVAMNMVTVKFSALYKRQGVLFFNLTPGSSEVGQNDGGELPMRAL